MEPPRTHGVKVPRKLPEKRLDRVTVRVLLTHGADDYDAFLEVMSEASIRAPMPVLAYRLMPNHFHLALWPRKDGDLSRWMHWLMTTHARRYLVRYRSSGHVWQGRFKASSTRRKMSIS